MCEVRLPAAPLISSTETAGYKMREKITYDYDQEHIKLGGGVNLKKLFGWVVSLAVVIGAAYVIFFMGGDGKKPAEGTAIVTEDKTTESTPAAAAIIPADTLQQATAGTETGDVTEPEEEQAEEVAGLQPVKTGAGEPAVTKPTVTKSETTKPAVPKSEVKQAKPDVSSYRFHVIVGAFGSRANAVELRDELVAKGLSSTIIPIRDGTLNAVTYSSFKTKEEALVGLRRVQREYDKNAWILEQ